MTVLDPVMHFLMACNKQTVNLYDVMHAADRPRRPTLRALDKLTKEGYLKEIVDIKQELRAGEVGPKRRNPTWKIVGNIEKRPKARVRKTTLRAKVWKLIRAKRHFTKEALVITSGASVATVDEYVRELERNKYVRKTGKDGRLVTFMLVKDQVDHPPLQRRQRHG